MSKPYYAGYVNHMLRLYFRCDPTSPNFKFEKSIDEDNYKIVDKVFDRLDPLQYAIMKEIYSQKKSYLDEVIRDVSKTQGVQEKEIWGLITKVTNAIACERGLI